MSELEHARMMLLMAHKDLKALKGMTDHETFDDEIFGFHAQQAVEKALKAWIACQFSECPKTHDIRLLLNILQQQGSDVEKLWELVELNLFAVQFRYEDYDPIDEPLDRQHLVEQIHSLCTLIEKQL